MYQFLHELPNYFESQDMRKYQENLKIALKNVANITDLVGEFAEYVVALCLLLISVFLIALIFSNKFRSLFVLFLFCTIFW